jgi:hypothetical protein
MTPSVEIKLVGMATRTMNVPRRVQEEQQHQACQQHGHAQFLLQVSQAAPRVDRGIGGHGDGHAGRQIRLDLG